MGRKVPVKERFGPAMRALTARRRKFVVALLQTGGLGHKNHARAAQMAGFSGDENTLRVYAHRLTHDPRVLAAIEEQGREMMHGGILYATQALIEVAGDPMHKDRIKAAAAILDRVGMHATSETRSTVVHIGSDEKAMIGRIKDLAHQLGVDPVKLLGRQIVEAEYSEVPPGDDDDLFIAAPPEDAQ